MSAYTFKDPCISCGQVPSYNGTLMCDPCTTGEAATLWDWLDSVDAIATAERGLMIKHLQKIFGEMRAAGVIDKKGNIDPIAATVMHLDQSILDKIEALL